MHHIDRSTRVSGALLGFLACLVAAPPALADTQPLHLGVTGIQFTSSTCLNDPCSLLQVTADGKTTSNLATGAGTEQATLIVDFSPGGSCNIVDESDTFALDNGTILIHSHHEDCATNGLRINTAFQITSGTGTFQGATGSGREFTATTPAAASKEPIIFNGTISF
jgi:hypothetical protein